jgi:phosphate:Na+ symporter
MFLHILSFVGALGIFLYGMKIMSEGLEKTAGDRLRGVLSSMTSNRFAGVVTGMGVTAVIQSSSATTVMVVSFVNAGLMTLRQAIGVIMGANIGTTVTAWIVAFIGFKMDIAALSLPLMAVAAPLLFIGKGKWKNLGECIIGFALLFMGLNLLSEAAEAMEIGKHMGEWLTHIDVNAWWAIPLFLFAGMILTMAMQSSSASMAITLMLFDMNIPGFGLAQAAALAMGQNIGTTITALLASFAGNTLAKRAALAHTLFNVFGVIIILCIFPLSIRATEILDKVIFGDSSNNMYLLSIFHTCFNIFNTMVMIGFVGQIEKLICRLIPEKGEKEEKRLVYISEGMLSTAELSLYQAKKEVDVFATRCERMLTMVQELFHTTNDDQFEEVFARISKYEGITDNMEVEIAKYLQRVSEGRLSNESKSKITAMLRQVDELESIGDDCFHLGRTFARKKENYKGDFTEEQKEHIEQMLQYILQCVANMKKALEDNNQLVFEQMAPYYELEQKINDYRSVLRDANLKDIETGKYSYQLGVFYMDFINHCEKLADHVINVVETLFLKDKE